MEIGNNLKADPIIELNQEALKRKEAGEKIINGTIGMMHLDNGALPIPNFFREAFSRHTKDEDMEYSSTSGVLSYRNSLIKWFFHDSLKDAIQDHRIETIATPGGTGALTLSFKDFSLKNHPIVLLPKLGWPNYPSQASLFIPSIDFYSNYNDQGTLDLENIKNKIDFSLANGYENVLLLLNDPCQNPTGYSLSDDERKKLLVLVNSYNNHVNILLDIAYFDYADEEAKKSLASFLLGLNSLTYICMSFSKTFSLYGLRIGALSLLSPNAQETEKHFHTSCQHARGLWSTVNHQAMNVIADLLSDENSLRDSHKEVDTNRDIIKNRATIFLREAKECGLEVFPYKFGFYISLPCNDALLTCNRLKEIGIFLSPVTTKVLRVAICCIPTEDIYGLAKKIKEKE